MPATNFAEICYRCFLVFAAGLFSFHKDSAIQSLSFLKAKL